MRNLSEQSRKLENDFQASVIKKLKIISLGDIILKNDASYIQGIPDLLILHGDTWAALECKRSINAPRRPNQEYYVNKMREMSYASFIYPENEEEVFNELQRAFEARRSTRFS